MPDPIPAAPRATPVAPGGQPPESSGGLTAEQLARLADLVATDQAPFPAGLTAGQERRLADEVRRRRRARLLRLVARCVAQDIHGARAPATATRLPENKT